MLSVICERWGQRVTHPSTHTHTRNDERDVNNTPRHRSASQPWAGRQRAERGRNCSWDGADAASPEDTQHAPGPGVEHDKSSSCSALLQAEPWFCPTCWWLLAAVGSGAMAALPQGSFQGLEPSDSSQPKYFWHASNQPMPASSSNGLGYDGGQFPFPLAHPVRVSLIEAHM